MNLLPPMDGKAPQKQEVVDLLVEAGQGIEVLRGRTEGRQCSEPLFRRAKRSYRSSQKQRMAADST